MFSIISNSGKAVEEEIALAQVLQLAKIDVPDCGGGLRLAVLVARLALGRLGFRLLRFGCAWGCFGRGRGKFGEGERVGLHVDCVRAAAACLVGGIAVFPGLEQQVAHSLYKLWKIYY